MRVHYRLVGMAGNSAKTRIETEIPDLEGVNRVNVDLRDHTISVDFDEWVVSCYDIEIAIAETWPYKAKRIGGGA